MSSRILNSAPAKSLALRLPCATPRCRRCAPRPASASTQTRFSVLPAAAPTRSRPCARRGRFRGNDEEADELLSIEAELGGEGVEASVHVVVGVVPEVVDDFLE